MMYCNNMKCDFECEDSKVPMHCPKCRCGSFGRPKGYDPVKYVFLGGIQWWGGSLMLYQRYFQL